jgi:hypothetical protein
MTTLEELEKLLKAGTPGPWVMATGTSPLGDTGDFDGWVEIIGGGTRTVALWQADEEGDEADAALIVAAINALPGLIASARRVEEMRVALEEILLSRDFTNKASCHQADIARDALKVPS